MLFPTSDQPDGHPPGHAVPVEPMTRLAGHLLGYKWVLIFASVLGLLVSAIGLSFVTPRYEAQAVVIVDSRRNKLADSEGALSSIVIDQYQSALKSELELISSASLARYIITSLGLLSKPEYDSANTHVSTAARFEELRAAMLSVLRRILALVGWSAEPSPAIRPDQGGEAVAQDEAPSTDATLENAVKIFKKSFLVENDPKSLTIRMGYRSESPQLAAAVTNAVLRRYISLDEEVKTTAVNRSQHWLEDRISGMRADLVAADNAVEEFRASHKLATVRDRSPAQQSLLQLESLKVDALAEAATARLKVDQLRQDGHPDVLASSADILASPVIQGLRQQEVVARGQLAQLSATLLPSNPGVLKAAEQLRNLSNGIQAEVNRIVRSNVVALQLADMRVLALTAQVQAVQARIDTENVDDIKLRSLAADAGVKRQVLSALTQRYDQNTGIAFTPADSRVVSWASVPVDASSPRYGLVLAGGTLGFTFFAFLMSLGVERMRAGFGTIQELEDELGLVVAGFTPVLVQGARYRRKAPATIDPPPLRELALTVRALAHGPAAAGAARVVLVTSSLAGEGKSTMATLLARSVANSGQRCLLIDADIRTPALHDRLRVPATPGLVELTLDQAPVATVVRSVPGEQFDLLPAGRPTQDTLSPFTTDAFSRSLSDLRRNYEVIVIDTAPLLLASESLVLSGVADLTLFLVQWRVTPREVARKAALLLTRCSTGPCLSVLSQVDLRRMRRRDGQRMETYYRTAHRFS